MEAFALVPVPEAPLELEALGTFSDMGASDALLLELGAVELAEDDPLGVVLEAELLMLPASQVPFTCTLWPTCALRSSAVRSCTPFGCFLSTSAYPLPSFCTQPVMFAFLPLWSLEEVPIVAPVLLLLGELAVL